MPFSRYGHVNQVFVKVGDKVKLGQKIATNGTGNGQWAAHCHRDHPKTIPGGNYGFYNIGWTKEETIAQFVDPTKYPKALGEGYSHLGYDWLDLANYGTAAKPRMCYHPGLDENGKGSGNADYDAPVYCVAEGIVRYVYAGTGPNGGWGHLIVVEEIINDTSMTEKLKKAAKKLGFDFGDKLNDSEMDKLGEKISEVYDSNVELRVALEQCKSKPPVIKEVTVEVPVEKVVEKEVVVEKRVLESDMSAVELFRLALQKFLGGK